jgi:DNA (cytosine-5)-methyltransferase 1
MPTPTTLDNVEKRTTHAGGGLTLQGVVGGVNPVDAERLGRSGVEVQDWKVLPTPRAADSDETPETFRARQERNDRAFGMPLGVAVQDSTVWGEYEPVIRRWEQIMGTPAPSPTEITSKGTHRLSARFTEWMMGQPAGWITDPSIGISRNEQLKACGNGVVTQQAVAALSVMRARSEAA